MRSFFTMCRILPLTVFYFTANTILAQTYPENFSEVPVATGIFSPTAMAFSPDGRIFVARQNGELIVIENDVKLGTPAIDLVVNSSGERGLIGVALHPQFTVNGYIYLYYTLQSGIINRVSRFTMSGNTIDPGTEQIILNLDTLSSATNHNGGAMHFKGEYLYIAIGENANPSHAQNLDTYHGKLLRINDDGSAPVDNPFFDISATEQRKRIWAYGLRNPFTFAVREATGTVYVNDVGQSSWEEINDATSGGLNFGWPATEGATANPDYRGPVYAYQHGGGDGRGCAITGGTFFDPESTSYPETYQGAYFYQDLCNNWINYLDLEGDSSRHPFATGLDGQSLALSMGTDGNLYFLSRNAGSLFRVIYTNDEIPAITNQPQSVTVSEGQPATFSVAATGAEPLSYQWFKDSISIEGAIDSDLVIAAVNVADSGSYQVLVFNAFDSVMSNPATLTVTPFNAPPDATIHTPEQGAMYRGGDEITFSGLGEDQEDGDLSADALTWIVVFHHADHVHDGPPVANGVASGSFTIPVSGETATDVFYRLYLVVEDSEGLADTSFVDIHPYTSTITLQSDPPGLSLTLDGQEVTTPHVFSGVEGIERTLGVVTPQTLGAETWEFDIWAHGGAMQQIIPTPISDTTFIAHFVKQDGALGLEAPAPVKLVIYPNPVEESTVTVKTFLKTSGAVRLEVVDLLGKVLIEKRYDQLPSGEAALKLPLPSHQGLFIIRLEAGGQTGMGVVIIR